MKPKVPPSGEAAIDEIITHLYRRFKDWSQRGFGPEDVTWCEVKADIAEMICAVPPDSPLRGREAREKEITRLATIEECAQVVDTYGASMEAIAADIRALSASPPEPAAPLRGRNRDLIALDAAHQIKALPSDLHEAQKTARIQLIVLDAMASPPEQPANKE